MPILSNSSPMQFQGSETNRIMLLVLVALLPGILLSSWFFGYGLLINILLCCFTAVAVEALMVKLRRRDIKFHLRDNSALVSAVLLAISLPPGSSWWLPVLGISFALVIGKHAFGGLGQNPFNPAMSGYLFLLLWFPLQMTGWHIPHGNPLAWQGFVETMQLVFPGLTGTSVRAPGFVDGLALATPLIEYKLSAHSALFAAYDAGLPLFSRESGIGWELVNIAYLAGGLFLLARRIISWHIPLSIIATVLVLSVVFYSPGSAAVLGTPYLHLLGSATMLGAFFIATDPVSAATANPARLIYGMIIGCSIYAIRVWGSYLDSVAIAVLFGNFCAPLLDYYFRPRIYGHRRFGNIRKSAGEKA